MNETKAIQQAVKKAGGYAALGRELGISRHRVWNWANMGIRVPPQFVLDIEGATGISRHNLRPDVFGPRKKTA